MTGLTEQEKKQFYTAILNKVPAFGLGRTINTDEFTTALSKMSDEEIKEFITEEADKNAKLLEERKTRLQTQINEIDSKLTLLSSIKTTEGEIVK